MEKKVITWHGKKYYLLGKDEDGIKYYLEHPSWDCDWYWGFGYIETFDNNENPERSKDIDSHQHFDSLFLTGEWDKFNSYLISSVLDKKETWTLLELMKTFYTLKETAEVLGRGGSYISNNPAKESILDTDYAKHLNKEVLPKIMDEVIKLLS